MPSMPRGFSLFELLLVLALVAVLAGVAMPSFGAIAARNRSCSPRVGASK